MYSRKKFILKCSFIFIYFIIISEDYEQGSRRLQKSFKKRNVDSSDNEPQSSQNSDVVVMKLSAVTRALANQRPLIDRSLTEILEETVTEESTMNNVKTNLTTNRQGIYNCFLIGYHLIRKN